MSAHAHGPAPAPVTAPAPALAHEPAPASKGQNTGTLISIALLVVLMIGGLGFALSAPGKSCLQCGIKPPPPPPPVCTSDQWSCSDWGACGADGMQYRNCSMSYDCQGVETIPPPAFQQCVPPVPPAKAIELPLPPPPPQPAQPVQPAQSSPAAGCEGKLSKIFISTSVGVREVILPFGPPGTNAQFTQLVLGGQGKEIDSPTCQDVHRNFWVSFNNGFTVGEEDDLSLWIFIGDNRYNEGSDFDLIECESTQCNALGNVSDDGRVYYAVRWKH